jgi:hypothetical protein
MQTEEKFIQAKFLATLGKKLKFFALCQLEMLWPSLYNEDEKDERAAIGADLHDLPGPRPLALLPGEAALLPPSPPSVRSVYSRGRILG